MKVTYTSKSEIPCFGTLMKFNDMAAHKIVLTFVYVLSVAHSFLLETTDRNIERNVASKYRLPTDTVPIHYNVQLNPRINADDFTGETQVYFEVRKLTSNIVLNAKNLTIDESATNVTKPGYTLKPTKHSYVEDTEMLYFRFEEPLELGIYTLNLKFKGVLASDLYGFFKSFYVLEGDITVPFLATHFQPMSARRAFPCWDEPALKATFNISLKHFDNVTALSNMPAYLVEYDENDGKVWTHFETTPVMSTNILGFVVFDFTHISNSDGTMGVWVRNEKIGCATYFMEIVERATAELTRYLNSTVRVPKMDHVALPHFSSRAVENWGLIMYLEQAMPCNTSSMFFKMLNVLTVTHEIAHQWFGNLVSPAWWKYYWLSEGMATYLKYYITDKMFRNWRLMESTLIYTQGRTFYADENSNVPCINEDFTDSQSIRYRNPSIIYNKASLILSMLSHIIGEDVFQVGLLNYINSHQYSNVTSDDLWEAMQTALNESNIPHEEFRIKEVMDTWIEQTGYPLVTVIRNYTTGKTVIHQEPSPFSRNKTRRAWWIPINYATKTVPNFSTTKPTHWLRPDGKDILVEEINVDDWIIVNLQQTGYYIVNYDPENWSKIANYLNSDDYVNIHLSNRIQIINTAFRLMTTNQLRPALFLELTNYLRRETDSAVWYPTFQMLSYMDNYLYTPKGGEILKAYILGLMNKFIETVGYDEFSTDDDFTKSIKPEVIGWACRLGHPECKTKASARLNAYLEDPEVNKTSPDTETWILCMGLANANQTTWDKFADLKIRDTSGDLHKTIRYLSCTEDPDVIEYYWNTTVAENGTIINLTSSIEIFIQLTNNVVMNEDSKLDFILTNYDKIAPLTNSTDFILDSLIWKINRQDLIDKLKIFLRARGINKDSTISYREEAVRKIEEEVSRITCWLNKDNCGKIYEESTSALNSSDLQN